MDLSTTQLTHRSTNQQTDQLTNYSTKQATSGIHGGYRLVSTYDLPDSKPFRGVFRSKLWSSQIWSFPWGGGYFRVNFGHLKSEFFHWGVFRSKLWSSQIWSFPFVGGGVFLSKLWSAQIWSFPFGGAFRFEIPERGFLENLDTNFTVWGMCTQTCLCIIDSLSHTTYVETNQDIFKWTDWLIKHSTNWPTCQR